MQQIEEYLMECPDWPTAKEKIDCVNKSGILSGTNWYKIEKKIQREFKKMASQGGGSNGILNIQGNLNVSGDFLTSNSNKITK